VGSGAEVRRALKGEDVFLKEGGVGELEFFVEGLDVDAPQVPLLADLLRGVLRPRSREVAEVDDLIAGAEDFEALVDFFGSPPCDLWRWGR
jgi:hypothetical protein